VTNPEAHEHAVVAEGFSRRVLGAAPEDWDRAAPVEGWTARDVVRHLVEWFPAFLAAGGIPIPPAPSVDADPAAAWQAHRDAVQALLEEPGSAEAVLRHPYVGEVPLRQAVARFYTPDVFMHTWDLARATGQDETLDPVRCEELYQGLLSMGDALRVGGQYAEPVPVPADADPQTRMLGLIGRDPRPPGTAGPPR
jgi:uncharacterized protein (TIGR03086 family)